MTNPLDRLRGRLEPRTKSEGQNGKWCEHKRREGVGKKGKETLAHKPPDQDFDNLSLALS